MRRYENGKIYTIRSHQTEKIYIGSTCMPLSKRLHKHKSDYNTCRKISSCEILKYDDYYIELLENFPCRCRDELVKREGELIREHLKNVVNSYIAGRSNDERKQDHDEAKRILNYLRTTENKNKEEYKQIAEDYNKKNIKLYTSCRF